MIVGAFFKPYPQTYDVKWVIFNAVHVNLCAIARPEMTSVQTKYEMSSTSVRNKNTIRNQKAISWLQLSGVRKGMNVTL